MYIPHSPVGKAEGEGWGKAEATCIAGRLVNLMVAAATENDYDCEDYNPGAVIVEDVA